MIILMAIRSKGPRNPTILAYVEKMPSNNISYKQDTLTDERIIRRLNYLIKDAVPYQRKSFGCLGVHYLKIAVIHNARCCGIARYRAYFPPTWD